MKFLFVAITALLLPVLASAQLSITGKVTNTVGEALPGATITIIKPAMSAVADASGKYNFTGLKAGNYTLKASYIGYQAITRNIALGADEVINVTLNNGTLTAEEVTVSATRAT